MPQLTTEKAVQKGVIAALRLYGWFVQRNQQGLGATRGRPDLEAYKKGVALFVECKSPRGKLSAHQIEYSRHLYKAEMTVLVADDIERFLQQLEHVEQRLWGERRVKRLL